MANNNVSCTDPQIGKMIARYEMGLLSEEEKRKFESHLLECDACFQELYSMSSVIETMREHPESFLPEVAESKEQRQTQTLWQGIKSAFIYERKTSKRRAARPAWVPAVSVATGVVVVAAIILTSVYLRRRLTPYDDLETGVQALIARLETSLMPTQDTVPLVVDNFVMKGTEIGSQFGLYLRNTTEEELNRSTRFRLVEYNPTEEQVFLGAEYCQVSKGIRVLAKLKDPTGTMRSSTHEFMLSKKAIEGFKMFTSIYDTEFVRRLTDNYRNSDLDVRIWTKRGIESATYQEDESLEFYLWANESCYVYVLAFMSTGDTVRLVPNDYDPNNWIEANTVYQWPVDIGTGYTWTIAQPFKPDIIKVFASNEQLDVPNVGAVQYLSIEDQPRYAEASIVITPVQGR